MQVKQITEKGEYDVNAQPLTVQTSNGVTRLQNWSGESVDVRTEDLRKALSYEYPPLPTRKAS